MSNSVDPDETAHIWIYAVCKRLLLSFVAVKELRSYFFKSLKSSLVLFYLLRLIVLNSAYSVISMSTELFVR